MRRRLDVFLVRPTKYDDDGYVLRHVRGVLPSNSLACIYALSMDVARRGALGAVRLRVHVCDESVAAVPARRIARAARRGGALLCLVGVQTSQMPRAVDLAARFRARDVRVLIGGFHVSGTLAMLGGDAPELLRLAEIGATIVAGEIEEIWETVLVDAMNDRLAPRYDTLAARPSIARAPVPSVDARQRRRFVYRLFATVDTSRGCPFTCSFCTIVNVQGRTMRTRDPDRVAEAIAESYRRDGVSEYFFTDDDLARSPEWRRLFAALVRLREVEGMPVRFLMQVDLAAHRLPGFVDLARRAGCFQVFLGMESLNPQSLAGAAKRQNDVRTYREVIATWHAAGILTHVGYILGFPHDDAATIRRDLQTLRDEVRPAIASFFMLTPLPGSADHRRLAEAKTVMDEDLNRYDTFHPVLDHPRMSRLEWEALYREAWIAFYDVDAMRRRLREVPTGARDTLLQMYLWYKSAVAIEAFHPMMTGFVRLKPRRDRRPGLAIESRLRHFRRRVPELWAMARGYAQVWREARALRTEIAAAATSAADSTRHA